MVTTFVSHTARRRWSQPVVQRHDYRTIPPAHDAAQGFHVCSMAQIYLGNREINDAIRKGCNIANSFILGK